MFAIVNLSLQSSVQWQIAMPSKRHASLSVSISSVSFDCRRDLEHIGTGSASGCASIYSVIRVKLSCKNTILLSLSGSGIKDERLPIRTRPAVEKRHIYVYCVLDNESRPKSAEKIFGGRRFCEPCCSRW